MFFDIAGLNFSPFAPGTPQAITVTADSSIVDITGAGSGNAPAMIGSGGVNTAMGVDIGVGQGMAEPYVWIVVTTAGTTSNTLTVSLSAAPDNGSYGQGSYTVLYTSKAIVGSTLAAGDVLYFPVPPTLVNEEAEALPRFYKLTYTCSGSLTVSVSAGIVINPSSLLLAGRYGNNYLAV